MRLRAIQNSTIVSRGLMMERLTLRLPTDLHGRLVAEAQASRLSLNQLIVKALRRAVEPRDDAPVGERERLVEALGELRAGPEILGALPRYADAGLQARYRAASRSASDVMHA